jgi:flagellar hook assembly protein FlgD
MKKLVVLFVALAAISAAGVSMAAESQKLSTKGKMTMVDRNSDGKIDGVDIYDENGKVIRMGHDTDNDMVVDRWDATDDNTGVPIVTASDAAFELR